LPSSQNIELRSPVLEDGMSVFRLIQRCPPLDTNSSYCNFLQCVHFSNTSVVADSEGALAGFMSAYRLPEKPDTLFIWQIAVDQRARGQGLALQMLIHLLGRTSCKDISHIETTITRDNAPSWRLFESLAKRLGGNIQSVGWLDTKTHFDGQHDSELLVHIGPFNLDQSRDVL